MSRPFMNDEIKKMVNYNMNIRNNNNINIIKVACSSN